MKIHSEGQLVKLLYCYQVARKGIILTIETCCVKQMRRCRPHSIPQLIKEVLLSIVLVMFIDLQRTKVSGIVLVVVT